MRMQRALHRALKLTITGEMILLALIYVVHSTLLRASRVVTLAGKHVRPRRTWAGVRRSVAEQITAQHIVLALVREPFAYVCGVKVRV